MNLIIFCLVLGLSSVLSSDHVSNSIVLGMKYPGHWPGPYPPNSEPSWGYPPPPLEPPYPTDLNQGIEGNIFKEK